MELEYTEKEILRHLASNRNMVHALDTFRPVNMTALNHLRREHLIDGSPLDGYRILERGEKALKIGRFKPK